MVYLKKLIKLNVNIGTINNRYQFSFILNYKYALILSVCRAQFTSHSPQTIDKIRLICRKINVNYEFPYKQSCIIYYNTSQNKINFDLDANFNNIYINLFFVIFCILIHNNR